MTFMYRTFICQKMKGFSIFYPIKNLALFVPFCSITSCKKEENAVTETSIDLKNADEMPTGRKGLLRTLQGKPRF